MKILYFGTVCDLNHYQEMLKDCQNKPSVAPILFENALLSGMKSNGADVEIYSFPMVPTFPKSNILRMKNISDILSCGYTCKWMDTLNLPVIKQISRFRYAKKVIRRWCKESNSDDDVIVTYSVPPFLVKPVINLGKKHSKKTVAIVPDLPRDMYINDRSSGLLGVLKKIYLRFSIKRQGSYDGYVYLTEAMHEVVAPSKPYVVVEGIARNTCIHRPSLSRKSSPRAIMYAGMLNCKYGIANLLDAFESMNNEEAELWLFGMGTAVPEILKRAQNNSHIVYFGQKNHEEILEYEKKATLLINPRDPNELFTKYSFPSKTIEYMLSGTPVLTTRLPGIPLEYYDYVYSVKDNSVPELRAKMDEVLALSEDLLISKGLKAQSYIREKKNPEHQAKIIIHFIEDLCNDSKSKN